MFERIGFNSSTVILKLEDLAEYLSAEDYKGIKEYVANSSVNKDPYEFKVNLTPEYEWLRCFLYPYDEKRNVKNMSFGVLQNITELKKNQEAIESSKHFLEELIDNLPVSVYSLNVQTQKFIIWNKASEKLFNIAKYESLNRTPSEVFTKEMNIGFADKFTSLIESSVSIEYLEEEIIINNTKKIINSIFVPEIVNNKIQQILAISIDITQNKEIEQELIKARKNAENNAQYKSEYLATMSHDIRNPINAIVGFSKIIAEEEHLSAIEREEYAHLINSNARHLMVLISDIVDLAKIESGKLKIVKRQVFLLDTLKSLRTSFKHQVEKKSDVQLLLDEPRDDISIFTDESRLVQVFSNLLSNAMKYTDKGYIRYGYEIEKSFVKFYVKDTGIGISSQNRDRIFETFNRGDVTEGGGQSGSGLGLAICNKLVQFLGGEIWFESESGKGSQFFFTIPYTKSTKKPQQYNPEKRNIDVVDQNIQYDWSDKTILVVDDSPDILNFEKIILKKTGINILLASNGKEAINQVKSGANIDVVLMDVQMPILNGIDAMHQIKEYNKEIPVIAQTAFAMENDRKNFIQKGFNEYVAKPINKKILFQKLQVIFSKK
jgi:PAS domain S-box-containing protein